MPNTKLVLGTVQLGMKYGLDETRERPSNEESFAILDEALAGGITIFDTAYAYGTAEDVLGEWISSRELKEKVRVISKMKQHALNDYPDGAKASDIVRMECEKSLKRLRIDALDGYLFHTPQYVYLAHAVAGLRKLKEDGLVRNIGVSIYDEAEALYAAKLGVDYIQVPYNALDQRLEQTDFFDVAEKNGVTIFARSPFLQGLLTMEPDEIPPRLAHARPAVERFREIAERHGLSAIDAALSFVCADPRIEHVVFGVDTLEQLRHALDVAASCTHGDWADEMRAAFQSVDRTVVNPSLWSTVRA